MGGNLVESMIGAVVLAVAGAFLYIAYTTTNVGSASGYELQARFDRVGGLTLGADVRISGIKIGTVTGQRLDPQSYQAVVRFTVDKSLEISTDSFAKITSDGLLGDTYVELQPGGLDEYLSAGEEVYDTQGPIDLFGLISKAVYSGDPASSSEE
ncbi:MULTISPECIES: outer membrane lipid asymmetry maintenance protein MlaD [unclassified Iodidimonas]|uniref:outer membrane lipid asymmetry maintenance protein MlaD n=1 Tax=unclassified Iodidimonas TaxID=2626145 RepID=UPI002483205F|nr:MULTISPECIES: outer membrane lipid asymmetry maintenance protein MlaD [unclassified Iodidimonas]